MRQARYVGIIVAISAALLIASCGSSDPPRCKRLSKYMNGFAKLVAYKNDPAKFEMEYNKHVAWNRGFLDELPTGTAGILIDCQQAALNGDEETFKRLYSVLLDWCHRNRE